MFAGKTARQNGPNHHQSAPVAAPLGASRPRGDVELAISLSYRGFARMFADQDPAVNQR
jgi:hypothetical protein